MKIGELLVTLGLATDKGSFAQGQRAISGLQKAALGLGAALGVGGLAKAMVGFNASVEQAKNQIASMLSFAKQTSLTDELANADKLYDGLRKKAAELPGSTQDYINMLGMLTQPLAGAGASLAQMEEITVRSFVLSKGLGEQWQKSARDLRELINFGKLSSVDTFSRTLLSSAGIDANDEGRAKLKGMTKAERLALVERQLAGPQITQMIERQANSFTGRLERLKDTAAQLLGRIGKSLFDALGPSLQKLGDWLDRNRDRINAWADDVGARVAGAFKFLVSHKDEVLDALKALGVAFAALGIRAAVAWLAVAWPVLAGAGLVYGLKKLGDVLGPIPMLLVAIGTSALLAWTGILGPVGLVLVGLAALAVGFVFFKDETIAAIDAVVEKVKDMFGWFNKIPFVSNFIESAQAVGSLFTGEFGDAGTHALKALNPLDFAFAEPSRGAENWSPTITQTNHVEIVAKEGQSPTELRTAFDSQTGEYLDAQLRMARRSLTHNR